MTTRLERVKLLHEQKYTNAEIGAVIGVGPRQVTRLKRQAGIPPANGNSLPPGVREEIRRRSEEDGWPPEEIVSTLGVSYEAAWKWSVRGVGSEWTDIARELAMRHPALWYELRP